MTDFGYWQHQYNEIGVVLCMSCFDVFPVEEMYRDENGDTWDECLICHELEVERGS